MKFNLLLFTLAVCCATVCSRGVNGGLSCAVCTVVMGVALQVAEIKEESIFNATRRLCHYLPDKVEGECLTLLEEVEPIFNDVSEKITPDLFCLIYGTCKVDPGQEICHLFPLPVKTLDTVHEMKKRVVRSIDVCTFPILRDICQILNNSYITLKAAQDFDNDGFSIINTARGSDWKGKDCRDSDENFYPGRLPLYVDVEADSNCNGIYGMNQLNNRPWEEILCRKSDPKGLIYIGDSIGAHFHMPQIWINPIEFNWPSSNATDVILDEIDWPQYGFPTGYKDIYPNILIKGPVDSIYLRLRKRNRCNHRDYQNLSQNGASSYDGISHAESITRNQTRDNPAIVIYAMQGNDVCNNFEDTIANMTSAEQFRSNVMQTLNVLNRKLPKKSHVILMGLVNADFIYPKMANRLHPIGTKHRNVYYKDLYKWFNCMQIGPCTGWLNSNETLRQITTQHAKILTNVLRDIVEHEHFKYFKLHFVENPINLIVNEEKVSVPDLLESVDSLHPNQRAQPLMTEKLWSQILTNLPEEVLGPVNKYNMKIKKLFGNQGGH